MLPLIVASAVRYIIIAIAQITIFQAVLDYILPLIQKAVTEIMKAMGVSEETAKDIFANELIQYAESVGVFALTLRTKMPVKLAEYLGFTSKGYKIRKIENQLAALVEAQKDSVTGLPIIGSQVMKDLLPTIAAKTGASLVTVQGAFDTIMKVLGVGFLGAMTVGNFLDFGNWNSGAYQKTFQNLWGKVGLEPDQDFSKPKVVSEAMFSKIYNTFKLEGATQVKNPDNGQVLPFTRDNMILITDNIAAGMLAAGEKLTAQKLIGLIAALSTFVAPKTISVQAAAKPDIAPAVAVDAPRIFTGIIANGKLTLAPEFIPRADSLIESVEELQEAAFYNLSEYLAALPGRVTYEIKLVSSVVDTDGIRRQGTSIQIISGYNKDGTPRYRKVVNKWAVVTLYFIKKSGGRSKIDDIILGPTDAVKLNPSLNTVIALNDSIKNNIATSNISDIKVIQTNDAVAVQAIPEKTPAQPAAVQPPEEAKKESAPTPAPAPAPVSEPAPAPATKRQEPVGGFTIYLTAVQRYAATGGAEYYKFTDGNEVYETATGRHIEYTEAVQKNIWNKIKTINRV